MRFDWSTLILQTVNLLVLLWLLRRFLFRPVVAIVAQRRDAAEKLLADAAAARDQARAQAEQMAQREKALAADGDRIMADARAAADAERVTLLERSKAEIAQQRDAAQIGLEQEKSQIRRALESEARHLAVAIASRLLGRMRAPALDLALLESLSALPAEQWLTLAGPDQTLEVVTASPMDATMQAKCTDMVRKHLECRIHFDSDPSLIAGVELRGPHAKLHNNWRADLDRIATELQQDESHVILA
jgi:F-type H+-transporting ATPase subunit b